MRRSALSSLLLWAGSALASSYTTVCKQIGSTISNQSAVFWPVEINYHRDILHWASSSQQSSACSVEPGTPTDLSAILGILSSTNTSFAVKGGGHTSNPGFSSTEGVHISLSRFNGVVYDASSQTATVGGGLIWDEVYEALAPLGVNVVGGRSSGVGVGGFSLGGGFSWKSNQFGMSVDTIVAYELVKPTGEIVNVTQTSDPELFWGLKGGMNNFGIVTKFTFRTHSQGQVWGGLITFMPNQVAAVTAATAKFCATNTDPKASLITAYNYVLVAGVSLVLFYDGPAPPAGIFDDFLAIPHLTSGVKTTEFLDVVSQAGVNMTYGQRGVFHSVTLQEFTPNILNVIANESVFWGSKLSPLKTGTLISYDVEPLLNRTYAQASLPSAWPPSSHRNTGLVVLNIYYAWIGSSFDQDFHDAAKQSAEQITRAAVQERQRVQDGPLYPNYAIWDTPLERMYLENTERLKTLKQKIDPDNVMGLAGGFRF